MNKAKIVIIGGVAAGASAAARLRRLNEAAEIFEKHKINYSYIKLTDVIIGRDGKNPCIMEQAVKSAKTPVEAYNRIKQVFSEISTVF